MTLQRLSMSIPGAALLNAEVRSGPVLILRGLVVGSALLRRGQLRRGGGRGRGRVAPSHEALQTRHLGFKFGLGFYTYVATTARVSLSYDVID